MYKRDNQVQKQLQVQELKKQLSNSVNQGKCPSCNKEDSLKSFQDWFYKDKIFRVIHLVFPQCDKDSSYGGCYDGCACEYKEIVVKAFFNDIDEACRYVESTGDSDFQIEKYSFNHGHYEVYNRDWYEDKKVDEMYKRMK